ncbi:MAG: hypothetical protein Q4A28_05350 [Brachymonas sp.]|nr:hypothetical protein [Brachymonas sp.]
MTVFFSHLRGGMAALAGSAVALLAHGVAQAQSASQPQSLDAIEARVQAQVKAAQAAADAAVSRANKQIAAAEARAQAISNSAPGKAHSNVHASGHSVRVVQSSGSGVNSINVVGNQAGQVVVECQGEPGAQVNVNSVVADGKSLQGKTVIVTGRNSHDVQVRGNCKQVKGSHTSTGGVSNVNSVTIR